MSARRGSRSRPRAPSSSTSPTARTSCRSRRCNDRRTFPRRSSTRSRSSRSRASRPSRRSSASSPPSICCWSSTTASTCRAPRRSSGGSPVAVSRRHRAGHEPRTARRAGRALLPGAAARAAGARNGPGGSWPTRTPWRCSASARERTTPSSTRASDNMDAIAEICRRVDGLPLAIELAAARCGLLSPAEIAARLHGALDGLGAGPRDAPARQQTLRATIDWSHSLLSDDEQACFARFAVFAGGATVEAAETITGAGIDTLDRLVAKSLLVRRHEAHGPTRLGMLETIRAYAAERFAAVARPRIGARAPLPLLPGRWLRRHGPDSALDGPNRARAPRVLWTARSRTSAPRSHWAARARRDGSSPRAVRGARRLLDAARPICGGRRIGSSRRCSKPDAAADPAVRARALCKVCWPLWALGRARRSACAALGGRGDRQDAVGSRAPSPTCSINCAALMSYQRSSRTSRRRSPTRRWHARSRPAMRG